MRAALDVLRYDPQTGAERRWQRYEVELPAGSTVLEALMAVQDDQDGTLTFRRACRHAICGSCGMRVNGCAKLACNTQVSVAMEQAARMGVEPPAIPIEMVRNGSPARTVGMSASVSVTQRFIGATGQLPKKTIGRKLFVARCERVYTVYMRGSLGR